MAISLIAGCTSTVPLNPYPDECFRTFSEFAYSGPPDKNEKYKLETTLPLPPWRIESLIKPPNDGSFTGGSVELVRSFEAYSEVWVSIGDFIDLPNSRPIYRTRYLVYRTDTKSWTLIPAQVGKEPVFITKLFLALDGTVWGQANWEDDKPATARPLLAKYQENLGRFEYDAASRGLPAFFEKTKSLDRYTSDVFLDSQKTFWVITPEDAIYSYDLILQKIVRHADMPAKKYVLYSQLASDGNIYISVSTKMIEDEILVFSPKSEKLDTIQKPWINWPEMEGIFMDDQGRLWLGAFGWRDANGGWITHHPNPRQYFWKTIWVQDGRWRSPDITLQSTDGRLWFRKLLSETQPWGMAWYDPAAQVGCWFTTKYTNLVEDQQGELWMVVDDVLYRYSLND
jgi:hypothetical protein